MLSPLFDTLTICMAPLVGARVSLAASEESNARSAPSKPVARAAAGAWRAIALWGERAQLNRRLSELDDHLLADIGLRRDQIPRLVAGLPLGAEGSEDGPGFVRRALARVAAWRARGRLRRELMELDDRMLADIGIRRSDIPMVLVERLRRATPNPAQPWAAPGSDRPVKTASPKFEPQQPPRSLAA